MWYGPTGLVLMAVPFIWMTLFFASGTSGRVVMAIVTLVVFVTFQDESGMTHTSMAQASAFRRLRELQISTADSKTKHGVYPGSMSQPPELYRYDRAYEYRYIPVRNASGVITDYRLQADLSELGQKCGCYVSYVGESDGRIHYTQQARPATTTDPILE